MEEITLDTKRKIIEGQLAVYQNTRYLLEKQYAVGKKIGETPERLKQISDDLVKTEMAIEEWEKILTELESEKQ